MAVNSVNVGSTVRFGEITVGNELGRGGFGSVYEATIAGIDFKFAIKFLDPSPFNDGEEARSRFFREAELLLKLRHQHIVAIYGLGEHDGRAFILMERFRGMSINKVRENGTPKPNEVLSFVEMCARALAFAHRENVVHRDIKPSNLMTIKGDARVLDFGIATLLDPDGTRLTGTAGIGGDAYSAPELVENPRLRDARCDIYSLGASWFWLLTGRTPKGLNWEAALRGAVDMAPEYERVMLRCLEQPERRYASMTELADDIAALQRGDTPPVRHDELNDTDIVVIGTIASLCGHPGSTTTYYRIEQQIEAGVTPLALRVSYRKLFRLKLLETQQERDSFGEEYVAMHLSTDGDRWVETHQARIEKLIATRAAARVASATSSIDDIPF